MGQIKVKKNVGGIEGLCIIEPTVHGDSRGYFMETYNKNDMAEAGLTMEFVQDNQSSSSKGVLRGLHFQKQHPQGKLVRVIKGTVFDVVVDLRSHSETYGKWFGEILSAENNKQFYIPEGFAHGFLVRQRGRRRPHRSGHPPGWTGCLPGGPCLPVRPAGRLRRTG